MSGVLESSLVAGFSNLRLCALRVFCSSVTWDTPRRRIHQKFTLTSLSSLLFYLFHLLFRLKTLDRSIDFLALPSSSSIKVPVYWWVSVSYYLCMCVCVLTWWPVGLLPLLFVPAGFWRFRCGRRRCLFLFFIHTYMYVFFCCASPYFLFEHFLVVLLCWYSHLVLLPGRIVDTLLTTFLDEFVGFLISLPLALARPLGSLFQLVLSDITHTPRWSPISAFLFGCVSVSFSLSPSLFLFYFSSWFLLLYFIFIFIWFRFCF